MNYEDYQNESAKLVVLLAALKDSKSSKKFQREKLIRYMNRAHRLFHDYTSPQGEVVKNEAKSQTRK